MNKLFLVALFAVAATVVLAVDPKCNKAADLFVKDYNEKAGDHYVKELDKVTGCWTVGDDLHLSLIMKTGEGYYKSCLNVIVRSAETPSEVVSYGTCRK